MDDSKKLIDEAIASIDQRGVTDEDITKFTGAIEAHLINGLQTVAGKVRELAAYQTFAGTPNMIGKELEQYTNVKKKDVLRVFNQYIKGKPAVILSVVPKGQETDIVAANNYTVPDSSVRYFIMICRVTTWYIKIKFSTPLQRKRSASWPRSGFAPKR